ncbi:MAG: tRNA preQ1(34) S-adenosylmethionine ribosyltransferase-isomerase QueA [Candidatus Methylacidiphilales bacterium]
MTEKLPRHPSPYRAEDFHFHLPQELIAAYPLEKRSASRLMIVNRAAGTIEHHRFEELPSLLTAGDLLVMNDTRVRLGNMRSVDGMLEALLLEELSPRRWMVMVKPGRRAKVGSVFRFMVPATPQSADKIEVSAEVVEILPEGERILVFDKDFCADEAGEVPLPPYIRKRRPAVAAPQGFVDEERYQTVYANQAGSSAAPTAGLHFTPELLAQLDHAFVTLHVGAGTFRPLRSSELHEHVMHEEAFTIPPGLAERVASAKRTVAVGTTSARVLESAETLKPQTGRTSIFIYPPYQFKRVDVLITNFHLPDTTLMLLVCAFGGKDLIMKAYQEAVKERYRFFSYGDAMLIL